MLARSLNFALVPRKSARDGYKRFMLQRNAYGGSIVTEQSDKG